MIHPIRLYGDPVLRKPTVRVTEFDGMLKQLADDLIATQEKAGAVGLAAVQIGSNWNVFSIDGSQVQRRGRREVLVNPEIAEQDGEITDEEGCLSFPGIFVRITRPSRVAIRAYDLSGKPVEREADGFIARAYLHEIEHLQGRLFIDRMDPDTRARVVGKMQTAAAKRGPGQSVFPMAPGHDGPL
ncbi:MAG: peptide deformylase [candidate division Zixibacteria bacterium]|nr:peptide deformylase [candidate division Zixibacteria bacterium]